MRQKRLESDTRMKYLLGNNPTGELVKIVSNVCKKIEQKRQKITS